MYRNTPLIHLRNLTQLDTNHGQKLCHDHDRMKAKNPAGPLGPNLHPNRTRFSLCCLYPQRTPLAPPIKKGGHKSTQVSCTVKEGAYLQSPTGVSQLSKVARGVTALYKGDASDRKKKSPKSARLTVQDFPASPALSHVSGHLEYTKHVSPNAAASTLQTTLH